MGVLIRARVSCAPTKVYILIKVISQSIAFGLSFIAHEHAPLTLSQSVAIPTHLMT